MSRIKYDSLLKATIKEGNTCDFSIEYCLVLAYKKKEIVMPPFKYIYW